MSARTDACTVTRDSCLCACVRTQSRCAPTRGAARCRHSESRCQRGAGRRWTESRGGVGTRAWLFFASIARVPVVLMRRCLAARRCLRAVVECAWWGWGCAGRDGDPGPERDGREGGWRCAARGSARALTARLWRQAAAIADACSAAPREFWRLHASLAPAIVQATYADEVFATATDVLVAVAAHLVST